MASRVKRSRTGSVREDSSAEDQGPKVTATIKQAGAIIDGEMQEEGAEVSLSLAEVAQYRRHGLCIGLSEADEKALAKNVK